jgi:hypothetical protein
MPFRSYIMLLLQMWLGTQAGITSVLGRCLAAPLACRGAIRPEQHSIALVISSQNCCKIKFTGFFGLV